MRPSSLCRRRLVVALCLALAGVVDGDRVNARPPVLLSLRLQQRQSPALVAAPSPLLRLRGGDGVSALQKLQGAYLGVPIFTRSWLSAILALAALNQVGVLAPEVLALDATATMQRLQLWRPITAAAFMGGLGMQLLQKCYYLIQFGKDLERMLGTPEFARVFASCTALLCVVCTILGWQFVGDGLIMSVTVLACQQVPDQQVNLYGLQIPCAYLPFAQLCMSYLFTQQIPWQDMLGALVGYTQYVISDNCKPDNVIYKRDNYPGKALAGGKGGKTLGAPKLAGGSSKISKARKAGGSSGGRKARKPNIATFASQASCGAGG